MIIRTMIRETLSAKQTTSDELLANFIYTLLAGRYAAGSAGEKPAPKKETNPALVPSGAEDRDLDAPAKK